MQQLNKRGMYPGALLFTGKKKVEEIKITVFDFDADSLNEREIKNLNELPDFKQGAKISWLNITGLHDIKTIEKIGEIFGIHPLVLEDILNVQHSPKIDNYEDYLFIVAKMIDLDPLQQLNIEQVSFILGKNYLITFQEDEEDLFEVIRQRLRENLGRLRKSGSDYLMYRLLDAIVDNYFLLLDNLDKRIEKMEDKIFLDPDRASITSLHILRKELTRLRRAVYPLRDVIFSLEKEREAFIKKTTYMFLRDLGDHLKHFVDSIDQHRDAMNGLFVFIYLIQVSE
jgi:magnesium transporter